MNDKINNQSLNYRYSLSENDKMIIKHYTDKPLSSNAEKTLTILSEVFGGLHHLDSDQLELFDYQSSWYNEYLVNRSLATFDDQYLTLLVIMAHDMAVRLEIEATNLSLDNPLDAKLLKKHLEELNSEYDYNFTMTQYLSEGTQPYLRLLFHQRQRNGDFSQRHPTIEDTTSGFRANNKRYA